MWATIDLPTLSSGARDAVVGAVVGGFIATLTALFVTRSSNRLHWRLETIRRQQERRQSVYEDVMMLIRPAARWLKKLENAPGTDVPPPPQLDHALEARVCVRMDLYVRNATGMLWLEWADAYQDVLNEAQSGGSIAAATLGRLRSADHLLFRSVQEDLVPQRSRTDALVSDWSLLKRWYRHDVTFNGEPTVSQMARTSVANLVKRLRGKARHPVS
jgi:hypothetical protein